MLFTKFVNALNIPFASTRWNSLSSVEIAPTYSNLVNPDQVNLTTKVGVYNCKNPFLIYIDNLTTKEEIDKTEALPIINTKHCQTFEKFQEIIEKINTSRQIGVHLGLSDKDDAIIDYILDKKFVQPIIIIDGKLTQAAKEQCRRLNLKYRNLILLWVENVYAPAIVDQMLNMGVEGFIVDDNGPTTTYLLNIYHCLYARQSNAKLICRNNSYHIIAATAGADLFYVDDSLSVEYYIKSLKKDLMEHGCYNLKDAANNLQFLELR